VRTRVFARAFKYPVHPKTENTMSNSNRIQTPEEARAIESRLTIRIDKLEREIDAVAKAAASDIEALAGDSPVDSTELTTLKAELQILEAALANAKDAVTRADRLQVAKVIIARRDKANGLMAARLALAKQTSDALDGVAALLHALQANTHALNPEIRRERGKDSATPEGYRAHSRSLLGPDHVQKLVESHFQRTVPGWRYEGNDAVYATSFAQGMQEAHVQHVADLDILLGTVQPADLKAIRAEQAETREPASADGIGIEPSDADRESAELEAMIAEGALELDMPPGGI
jgi:hypothetical protein